MDVTFKTLVVFALLLLEKRHFLVTNRKYQGTEDSPVPSSSSGQAQLIFVDQRLTDCYHQ